MIYNILPVSAAGGRTGSIPVTGSNACMAEYIRILLLVALSYFIERCRKQEILRWQNWFESNFLFVVSKEDAALVELLLFQNFYSLLGLSA